MPIVHVMCKDANCPKLGVVVRRLVPNPKGVKCQVCDTVMTRVPNGPGCSVVERLDNGAMPKVVERPVGIQEMIDERTKEG